MKFVDIKTVIKKFPEAVHKDLILCEEKELVMYIIGKTTEGVPQKFIQGYVEGNFVEFDLYIGNKSFVLKGDLKENIGSVLQVAKNYELGYDEIDGFIPFQEASRLNHILGIKKSRNKKSGNFDDNKVFNRPQLLKAGKINLPSEEKLSVIDTHDYFIVEEDVLGGNLENMNAIDFGSKKVLKGKPTIKPKPIKKVKPTPVPAVKEVKEVSITRPSVTKVVDRKPISSITKPINKPNTSIMPLVLDIINNTIDELLLRPFNTNSYDELKKLAYSSAVKETINQVISRPMNQFIVTYLFKIVHKDAVPVKKWENIIKDKFKLLIG